MKLASPVNGRKVEINPHAVELAQLHDLEDEIFTINCGLHSGFPDCCIIFHTKHYIVEKDMNFIVAHNKLFRKKAPLLYYIPCPQCLHNGPKYVKIKRCTCWAELRIIRMIERGKYNPSEYIN